MEKDEEIRLWEQETANLQEQLAIYQDEEGGNIDDMVRRVQDLEEELRYSQEEIERLRTENEEFTSKFETVEDFIEENDNLRQLLIHLKDKLEIQVDSYNMLWNRVNRELELKRALKEEVNNRIEKIRNFNPIEIAQYYEKEIENFKTEILQLKENKSSSDNYVEELKSEIQMMREEIEGDEERYMEEESGSVNSR